MMATYVIDARLKLTRINEDEITFHERLEHSPAQAAVLGGVPPVSMFLVNQRG
jgi:hypothetical protein